MSQSRALAGALLGTLVVGALFAGVESLWPERSEQRRWRSGSGVDVAWLAIDHFVRIMATVLLGVVIVVVARVVPHPMLGGISSQPAWLQLLEVLVAGDALGYAMHRLFHRPGLWNIHAVHHSIEEVDWLSAGRVHPIDTLITRVVVTVPLFFVGFSSTRVLPVYAILLSLYPIYLHANVRWRYGPLRFVIASPAFHRWHHTAEQQGMDKNFAGLFPFLDLLCGTFHMPNRASREYGLGFGKHIPNRLGAQLLHPFRANAGSSPARSGIDHTG